MTTEPNNIKKLQQRNYNLVVENEFLKEENKEIGLLNIELNKTIQQLKDVKYNYIELYKQLKQQNTELKFKNRQQSKLIERLITIITDEHYN